MILLVSAVFPPEPVVSASIAYDLATSLSEDWGVTVITPKPSRPKGFSFEGKHSNNQKFEHIILNSYIYPDSKFIGRMLESYSFGRHSAKFIKKNRTKIKCIYLNSWPLFSQYIIVKIAKKYSIPLVIHEQDIYPESLLNKIHLFGKMVKMILMPISRYILTNADRIVAISENMVNTLVNTRNIPSNKIILVYNWQNEDAFINVNESDKTSEKNINESNIFKFMFLGNIGPVAGVDQLIKSFTKANLQKSVLVIAGTGSKKEECIQLAKYYNNLNIEFLDVSSGRVNEIQNQADILLLPMKKNFSMSSIPSKLSAYMFSKKPIIACVEEKSDTANAIKQANCGWIVPPEDSEALIKIMKTVVSIPIKELQRFGRRGFNYAMENFSKKKNLQKLVKIILETAAK